MALQVTIRPRPGIESAITGICTSPLAATQHRPRLLAPARQLVCRRDQRLLPRRVGTPIAPANHRSGTASGYNSTPEASASQVTSIRVAYGSAGHQLARSDHPGLYESAVGEVCCFKTFCSDHPCLLACLSRACRGVRPLSGLVSAIRRAEVLRHAGQYRELSTPVGTSADDPSHAGIESARTGISRPL